MNSDERRFFSGSTLAQALMAASRHFHLPPEELAYQQREKRHGFTHKARGVVIEIDPGAPRREGGSGGTSPAVPRVGAVPPRAAEPVARERAVSPGRGREERPPLERRARPESGVGREGRRPEVAEPGEEHVAAVRGAAETLLRLAGLAVEVDARVGRGRVQVRLEGTDATWLAERGPEPFEALEMLVKRMASTDGGESIPLAIDPPGGRDEREGELRSLALAAAQAVRRTGRAVELDPLPSRDRRVIHLALAEEVDLVTESRGEGRERRIEIRLRLGESVQSS